MKKRVVFPGNRKLNKETFTFNPFLICFYCFITPLPTHLCNLLGPGRGRLGRLPVLRLQGRGGGLLGEGSRHRRILHHHRLNLHTAIISKILY